MHRKDKLRTLSLHPVNFFNCNIMSINLKEAVDFLMSNGYVYWYGKKLKLHTKFYEDIEKQEMPASINWTDRYTNFIRDAGIPSRGESRNGEFYPLNKFSNPGLAAFRKAIEKGGVVEEWLLQSTKLYYKSGVRLKVAIGRYFHEGLWVTDYEAYKASLEAGTTQNHVKQETSDGSHTAWQLG